MSYHDTLVIMSMLLAGLVAYFTYNSNSGLIIKLIMLPFIIVYFLVGQAVFDSNFGQPLPYPPTDKVIYITHEVVGSKIHLVALTDKGERLFVFDFDEDTEEGLEGVETQTKEEGKQLTIRIKSGESEGAVEVWPTEPPTKE